MYDELTALGMRLKSLRKARNMTLSQLAEASSLSAGLLSRIENARTSPSLPVICAIARVLDCKVNDLFDAPEERLSGGTPRRWMLIRREEMRPIQREKSSGYDYQLIFESRLNASRLQVMLVTLEPGAQRKAVTGEGVESIYLLQGEIVYMLGDEKLLLRTGDTLFFDSSVPHFAQNDSSLPAVMLVHYYLRENIFEDA